MKKFESKTEREIKGLCTKMVVGERADGNKRTSGGWVDRFMSKGSLPPPELPPAGLASARIYHVGLQHLHQNERKKSPNHPHLSSFCGLWRARAGAGKGTKIQMPMSAWGVALRRREGMVVLGWPGCYAKLWSKTGKWAHSLVPMGFVSFGSVQ